MSFEKARVGCWTDYTSKSRQVLATDFWANIMKTLVAVALALSAKYITEIFQHWGIRFLEWWDRQPSGVERQPLLEASQNPGPGPRSISPAIEEGRSVTSHTFRRGQGSRTLSDSRQSMHLDATTEESEQDEAVAIFYSANGGRRKLLQKIYRSRLSGSQLTVLYILLLVLFTVFILQIIAGVFSAKVATDRAALWASDRCGIWMFDDENAGPDAASRADLYDREKEARAGDYAQSCYGAPSVGNPTHCEFFYFRNITYPKPFYSYECPFPSKDACTPSTQSITFNTGLVDASLLGINSELTHKFHRKTTCSPLNLGGSFSANITTNGSTTYFYQYGRTMRYGSQPSSNITYSTTGDPFNWQVAGYKVAAYATSLYPEYDYWRPIAELSPPGNTNLTILFINSLHVTYPKPSFDPIFPAHKLRTGESWYYNSDPRARAIGCIDATELCSPDGRICWPMNASVPEGVPTTPAYWLMKFSLEMSSIYNAMHWRLGSALVASTMISQYRSKPLSDDHWVLEVQRLFDTTLARAQFDAWSIASGEDSVHEGPDGYVETTPREAGNLCNKYKFKSSQHTNITFAAFVFLLSTPFVSWILSRTKRDSSRFLNLEQPHASDHEVETSTSYSRNRKHYPYETLIIDLIIVQIIFLVIWLCNAVPAWINKSTPNWVGVIVEWVKERVWFSRAHGSRSPQPSIATNF